MLLAIFELDDTKLVDGCIDRHNLAAATCRVDNDLANAVLLTVAGVLHSVNGVLSAPKGDAPRRCSECLVHRRARSE